ncbi:MAG: hypothetical protein GKR98_13415 [Boseongicola sp.]|nr:MAG: hypothetical protein GKR98_13415 [Boseongicola sp.]
MQLRWTITALVAALVVFGFGRGDQPNGNHSSLLAFGQPALMLPVSVMSLAVTSQSAPMRIEAIEVARGPQIAALPSNAPMYLDVNGGQNLRPLATTYSSARTFR